MNEAILNTAIKAFKNATGYTIKVKQKAKKETDAILHLDGADVDLIAEVKTELRNIHIQQLLVAKKNTAHTLLIAEYIPQPQKKALKDYGINYLDTAGNCYIKAGGMFVYINDAKATKPAKPKAGTLWTAAGIKFLFAILRNEALLNAPYRDIAAAAGIALGNIGNMLQQLEEEGFTKKDRQDEVEITHKNKLIEKWAIMYETKLRPKLVIGRYRTMVGLDIKKELAAAEPTTIYPYKMEGGTYWGGEAAAAYKTKYITPEIVTVYTNEPIGTLMTKLKLIPDNNGDWEVLQAFWPPDNEKNITPPLLTYADLIATFDSRNHEAAKRIKQQYLAQ